MEYDWRVLEAHISELEELEDDLLAAARTGDEKAKNVLSLLHRRLMEVRRRLLEMREGNP